MIDTDSTNLNFLNLLREFGAVGELARFARRMWTWPLDRRAARQRAILLIPGFIVGDVTLYPFADWLRSRGHQVFFSGILANTDCPRRAIQRLEGILLEQRARYEEKLVVIGHSLGGIYARELARRHPECVDQVILLGAPINDPLRNANPYVKMLGLMTRHIREASRGCHGDVATICGVHSLAPPPGVAETIVFSKSDGVVNWVGCLESGPDVTAFEVDSTHCGLPYNLDTMRIIQERIEED
jgi:serine aminopeptidase S33 family